MSKTEANPSRIVEINHKAGLAGQAAGTLRVRAESAADPGSKAVHHGGHGGTRRKSRTFQPRTYKQT